MSHIPLARLGQYRHVDHHLFRRRCSSGSQTLRSTSTAFSSGCQRLIQRRTLYLSLNIVSSSLGHQKRIPPHRPPHQNSEKFSCVMGKQGRKNNINITFWSEFPADIPDPSPGCPGQKVSPHHRGRRKTHVLVQTSMSSGADIHDFTSKIS